MTAFHGFRVPSARLTSADYRAGWFFVTGVTAGRASCLCRITGGRVVLTPAGRVVAEECARTPAVRPGVVVDVFVVMPDHVHLILGLDVGLDAGADVGSDVGVKTPQRGVSATAGTSGMGTSDAGARDAVVRDAVVRPWRPGVLGSDVGQIKGASTKRIRACIDPAFAWQTRFHDVIIRDARHHEAARRYVVQNPAEWDAHHRRIP